MACSSYYIHVNKYLPSTLLESELGKNRDTKSPLRHAACELAYDRVAATVSIVMVFRVGILPLSNVLFASKRTDRTPNDYLQLMWPKHARVRPNGSVLGKNWWSRVN